MYSLYNWPCEATRVSTLGVDAALRCTLFYSPVFQLPFAKKEFFSYEDIWVLLEDFLMDRQLIDFCGEASLCYQCSCRCCTTPKQQEAVDYRRVGASTPIIRNINININTVSN